MANHRSERRRWWRRDRMSADTDWQLAARTVTLRESEVIVAWSEPCYLELRHPWRKIPCLMCGESGTGAPMIAAVIMGAAVDCPNGYQIGTSGWLICAYHERPEGAELWAMAHFRDSPGCPCFTRSAADAASYPYHQGSQGWLM